MALGWVAPCVPSEMICRTLRRELSRRGLPQSGLKRVLIARLEEAVLAERDAYVVAKRHAAASSSQQSPPLSAAAPKPSSSPAISTTVPATPCGSTPAISMSSPIAHRDVARRAHGSEPCGGASTGDGATAGPPEPPPPAVAIASATGASAIPVVLGACTQAAVDTEPQAAVDSEPQAGASCVAGGGSDAVAGAAELGPSGSVPVRGAAHAMPGTTATAPGEESTAAVGNASHASTPPRESPVARVSGGVAAPRSAASGAGTCGEPNGSMGASATKRAELVKHLRAQARKRARDARAADLAPKSASAVSATSPHLAAASPAPGAATVSSPGAHAAGTVAVGLSACDDVAPRSEVDSTACCERASKRRRSSPRASAGDPRRSDAVGAPVSPGLPQGGNVAQASAGTPSQATVAAPGSRHTAEGSVPGAAGTEPAKHSNVVSNGSVKSFAERVERHNQEQCVHPRPLGSRVGTKQVRCARG